MAFNSRQNIIFKGFRFGLEEAINLKSPHQPLFLLISDLKNAFLTIVQLGLLWLSMLQHNPTEIRPPGPPWPRLSSYNFLAQLAVFLSTPKLSKLGMAFSPVRRRATVFCLSSDILL